MRTTRGTAASAPAFRDVAQRYGVALLTPAIALAMRAGLDPLWGDALPYFTLYPAVVAVAWYGGLGPGLVATGACAIGAAGLWVHPGWSPGAPELPRDVGLVGFAATCVAISILVARGRKTSRMVRAGLVRQAFLARASAELASSLEYEETLRALARLVVPAMADWCSVDVVDPDGTVRRLAVAHVDAANSAVAERAATYPPDPHGRHPRTQVLRTGRSLLVRDVTDDGLARMALDDDHLRALRTLGYRSAMIVALRARGQILGALSLATSTSGRHYAEDDLVHAEDLAHRAAVAVDNARLYTAAQEANRVKEEFLATVSHELRTPLQAILGWVHVLRQGKLDPDRTAHALEIMERAGRAQQKLIDELLDVSRIAAGTLELDTRPVDLADVVRQVLDEIRPVADAKPVRLVTDIGDGIGFVTGDAPRLRQVTSNLVGNAVKFTPGGGEVVVRLERAGDEVRMLVKDTGEGVSAEFLPQVFDAFRQAQSSAGRRHGGLGLGLAIVRRVVELHGGRVDARSEGHGRGAEFIVTLPLARLGGAEAAIPASAC